MQFVVELGQNVFGVHARFAKILDGSLFNNVSNDQLLNGLVLWYETAAVRAVDGNHTATSVLAAAIIAAFLCHRMILERY